MDVLITLWQWLNAQSGWLLAGGLAAAACLNWYKWLQDRKLVHRGGACDPRPMGAPTGPRTSVLAAAWNEADMIREHIEAFVRLRYPDKQLVLCAGGSDDTLAIAQEFASDRIVVLEQRAGEGKQRALGRCFDYATG